MFDLFFKNEKQKYYQWEITRRNAIINCNNMLEKTQGADPKAMKVFSYNSPELDAYGKILYKRKFDWGWPTFEEELQQVLSKFILYFNLTGIVFYLQVSNRNFSGWLAWHDQCREIYYELNGADPKGGLIESLRQLLFLVKKMKQVEEHKKVIRRIEVSSPARKIFVSL